MSSKNNHSDIEKMIDALKDPALNASRYLLQKPQRTNFPHLYKKLRLYKEALLHINEHEYAPDVNKQWQRFNAKISARKIRMQYLKYAAIFLLLLTSTYFLWTELENVNISGKGKSISMGTPKALLINESGQQFRLEDDAKDKVIIHDDKFEVSKEQNAIRYNINKEGAAPEETELRYHTIIVPRFGEWKLELPDGTKVWINADSRLKYPIQFSNQKREVFLTGEAYFEVSKDSLNPFIVNTEKVNTRVLGTSFNVSAYPEEDLNITLVEGKVLLKNKLDHSSCMLEPSDNAELKLDGTKLTLSKVDVRKYMSWRDGYYYFEREELDDILTKLQKWYDFEVFYENPNAKYYEFRMRADRNLEFEKIVKRLEETGRIKIEVIENSIVISDVKRN